METHGETFKTKTLSFTSFYKGRALGLFSISFPPPYRKTPLHLQLEPKFVDDHTSTTTPHNSIDNTRYGSSRGLRARSREISQIPQRPATRGLHREPHLVSASEIASYIRRGLTVLDFSSDDRLQDPNLAPSPPPIFFSKSSPGQNGPTSLASLTMSRESAADWSRLNQRNWSLPTSYEECWA